MTLDRTAWLWGLLPWAAVAGYLLTTAGRTAAVPHLDLWRGAAEVSRRAMRVRRRRPPAWVVAGLLAVVATIVGAAGPRRSGGAGGRAAVVVLDRGVTMAGRAGEPAFRGVVDRAAGLLGGRAAAFVAVPPVDGGRSGDWAAVARAAPPTGVDTGPALAAVVGELLRAGGTSPVLVLTDRAELSGDPRVVRVGPTVSDGGVGILDLAAGAGPRPQVMVRVANRSGRPAVHLRVESGSAAVERDVPTVGTVPATLFVDLPSLGPTVAAVVDPATVDGRAWLAVGHAPPRATATPGVPPAVGRLVAVFDEQEGSAGGGANVVVTDRALAADQAGVWVVPSTAAVGSAVGSAVVRDDAVTAGVTGWAGGGAAVPAGYAVVVTVDGRPTVAVRTAGAVRQVWANVDVEAWSRSADWVVFLANALRWAGGGATAYAAEAPHRLGDDWHRVAGEPPAGEVVGWWPGLFRSDDGRTVAINAAGGVGTAAVGGSVMPIVTTGGSGTAVGAVIALGLLAAAAAAWPRGRGW